MNTDDIPIGSICIEGKLTDEEIEILKKKWKEVIEILKKKWKEVFESIDFASIPIIYGEMDEPPEMQDE